MSVNDLDKVENPQWKELFTLLLDHSVSELEINGPDLVFIKQRGKRIHLEDVSFSSEKEYAESIEKYVVPFVDGMGDYNPEGSIYEGRLKYEHDDVVVQARCHIMLPPVCDYPQITMAKRSKTLTTVDALAEMGSMSTEMLHFVEMCADANLTIVLSGQSGAGKDLSEKTLIPTPTGFKKMGEIKIGDEIFNEQGQKTLVTNKYQPEKDKKYIVHLSNGEKITAGEGHLWRVIDLQSDLAKENSYNVRIPLTALNLSRLEVATLTDDEYLTTQEFIDFIEYEPVNQSNNIKTKDPILELIEKFEINAGQLFAITTRSILDANKPLFENATNETIQTLEKKLRAWDREEISFNELLELCNNDRTIFDRLTPAPHIIESKVVNKREVADFLLKDHWKRVNIRKLANDKTDEKVTTAFRNITTKEMYKEMYKNAVNSEKKENTEILENNVLNSDNDKKESILKSDNLANTIGRIANKVSHVVVGNTVFFGDSDDSVDIDDIENVVFAIERVNGPVKFSGGSNLLVSPYLMGLWLGGTHNNGSDGRIIACAKRHEIQEIKAKLTTSCNVRDSLISIVDKEGVDEDGDTVSTLRIKNFRQNLKKIYSDKKYDVSKGDFPKVIPDDYLFSSVRSREELIAGIIDGGGEVSTDGKGNCTFVSTSEELVHQIRTLVSSLGLRTSPIRLEKRTIEKDGEEVEISPGYKISFFFNRNHFGLNDHISAMQERMVNLENLGSQVEHSKVYVTKITEYEPDILENGEEEKFYCLEVDTPSHLYLAGETFIPTHNTTMLEAITKRIPSHYRIGVAEDTPELNLIQDNVTYLHSVPWAPGMDEKDVATLQWVVSQFQRNRCDKLIIGETRGKEFGDFLIAANSGMEGSMTTIHANDPAQCLTKMTNFAMKSADKQPVRAINTDIAAAVDIIIQLVVIDGKHRVSHISEVVPVLGNTEEAKITVADLYLWDRQEDAFYKKGQMSDHLRRILENRGIDHQEFIQSPQGKRYKHHNYGKNLAAQNFGSNAKTDSTPSQETPPKRPNGFGGLKRRGIPTPRTI